MSSLKKVLYAHFGLHAAEPEAAEGGVLQEGAGLVSFGMLDEGCAVFLQKFRVKRVGRLLVDPHLDICAEYEKCCPYQRVEPVDAEDEIANELDKTVPVLDVGPLVVKDIFLLIIVDLSGNEDLGRDEPDDKR